MNNVIVLDTDTLPRYEGTIAIVSVNDGIYVMWDGEVDYRIRLDTVELAWEHVYDETA